MSKNAITVDLEPPVLLEYRLELSDRRVRFFTAAEAGSTVYDRVNGRRCRLTTESLEPGVFRTELVG